MSMEKTTWKFAGFDIEAYYYEFDKINVYRADIYRDGKYLWHRSSGNPDRLVKEVNRFIVDCYTEEAIAWAKKHKMIPEMETVIDYLYEYYTIYINRNDED